MSALADVHLAKGDVVTGSDLRPNDLTDRLRQKGATIHQGHSAVNVPGDVDLVVRTTCIREDNPEVKKAHELGAPVISRSEMLKRIMDSFPFSIAVTGTHGKTTTSALVAHIAEYCGKDPTVIVGGEMGNFGSNAKFGHGDTVVAEVDESDGYFRNTGATCAVVTNVEREHMEHYGSLEKLVDAYKGFAGGISPKGFFVFNGEDPALRSIAGATAARKISFGIDGEFDVTCRDHTCARSIEFELIMRGKDSGRVSSSLIGRYNLMNILGAVTAGIEAGFGLDGITAAVSSFSGVRRRFDSVGRIGSIEVVEDYAHHPTELRSVIAAARGYTKGRIVTVFQPHRYSRTRDLMREFSDCFYGSDVLVLTDIYSADEDKVEEVRVRDIYEAMDKSRFERIDLAGKKDVPEIISDIARDDDVILVLGAGDIREVSGDIVEEIKRKRNYSGTRNMT